MRRTVIQIALVGLLSAVSAVAAPQNPPAGTPPAPPPAAPAPPAKPPAKTQDQASKSADDDNAAPLPATVDEDLEVGTFYLHKGDTDAAIPRFEDAIRQKPNLARPRLLLAEAYEKKGDKSTAVKYYKEYLRVFPKAADAKKIQSKIDKLSGD
jgi:tetratricopeptide (TPR) repeat protein